MVEKLIRTGKVTGDGREIFTDEHGIGWDLSPNHGSGEYRFAGRAVSDRSRVLVEEVGSSIKWDVSPARARGLIGRRRQK